MKNDNELKPLCFKLNYFKSNILPLPVWSCPEQKEISNKKNISSSMRVSDTQTSGAYIAKLDTSSSNSEQVVSSMDAFV